MPGCQESTYRPRCARYLLTKMMRTRLHLIIKSLTGLGRCMLAKQLTVANPTSINFGVSLVLSDDSPRHAVGDGGIMRHGMKVRNSSWHRISGPKDPKPWFPSVSLGSLWFPSARVLAARLDSCSYAQDLRSCYVLLGLCCF